MSQSFKSQTVTKKEEEMKLSYLCCNTCMVTSGNPQYSVALHPSPDGLQIDISLFYQQISLLKQSDSILNWSTHILHTTCCICSWQLPSNQSVFYSYSQSMTQVQSTSHVWWRDTQREGLIHSVR